jgi:hypothetical protein
MNLQEEPIPAEQVLNLLNDKVACHRYVYGWPLLWFCLWKFITRCDGCQINGQRLGPERGYVYNVPIAALLEEISSSWMIDYSDFQNRLLSDLLPARQGNFTPSLPVIPAENEGGMWKPMDYLMPGNHGDHRLRGHVSMPKALNLIGLAGTDNQSPVDSQGEYRRKIPSRQVQRYSVCRLVM